jgi:hypothetical protein
MYSTEKNVIRNTGKVVTENECNNLEENGDWGTVKREIFFTGIMSTDKLHCKVPACLIISLGKLNAIFSRKSFYTALFAVKRCFKNIGKTCNSSIYKIIERRFYTFMERFALTMILRKWNRVSIV